VSRNHALTRQRSAASSTTPTPEPRKGLLKPIGGLVAFLIAVLGIWAAK
jgi:hypothetical protein